MTQDIVRGSSPFDELKHVDEDGEHWYARELMTPFEYQQWRFFNDVINRARATMMNAGEDTTGHFRSIRRPAGSFSGAADINAGQGGRPALDFRLTRRACYYVALAGDSTKRAIAMAQQYFVTQTRKMEILEERASQVSVMPSHIEALRGWAEALEARAGAELPAAAATAVAEMLRPPAEAWMNLVDTGQDYDMATAAAILNRDPVIDTGRDRLRDWMLANRMLYRRGTGQLVPYSEHLVHIKLKPQTRPNHDADDPRARKEANAQVRITVKGLEWIQRRMREQNTPELVTAQHLLEASPQVTSTQEFRQKYERLRAKYGNQ
jgi:DNA-damage-inducible protein D